MTQYPIETGREISVDVRGKLSEVQQEELLALNGRIMQRFGLDQSNPEHRAEIFGVLGSCIRLGLQEQGRDSFTQTESLMPLFTTGLQKRQRTLSELAQMRGSFLFEHFTDDDVAKVSDNAHPLRSTYDDAAEALMVARARREAAEALHTVLFTRPSIRDDVSALSHELTLVYNEQELQTLDMNHRLYANVLLNLGLYQRLRVIVEPEDVATLIDMWHDQETKRTNQERITGAIRQIAEASNIPSEPVVAYTRAILNTMESVGRDGIVTRESLQNSQVFALSAVLEESLMDTTRKTTPISQREVTFAQQQAMSLIRKIATAGIQSQYPDEMLEDITPHFLEDFQSLSPLALYLSYTQRTLGTDVENALIAHVPLPIYAQALQFFETDQPPATQRRTVDRANKRRNYVYQRMREHVVKKLIREEFADTTVWTETVSALPPDIFEEYLRQATQITAEQHDALQALITPQTWASVACNAGVTWDPLSGHFEFFESSFFLEAYLQNFPQDIRQAIGEQMTPVVPL